MKIAIVISTNDPETVWNAFRFGSTSLAYDNEVTIFLMGKGIEALSSGTIKFDINAQLEIFNESGGNIIGCGVCLENRQEEMPYLHEDLQCEMGSMQQFYALIVESDKVVTF